MSSLSASSSFASAGLDDAHLALDVDVLLRHLPFDVFVILALTVAISLALTLSLSLDHVASRRWIGLTSIRIVLEIVRESAVLASGVLLALVRRVVLVGLARYAWKLLLGLGYSDAAALHPRLRLLVLACRRPSSTSEPDLLILILIVLYRQFRLAGLDLVAFLADAFCRHIVALLFVLFFGIAYLQMSSNEG